MHAEQTIARITAASRPDIAARLVRAAREAWRLFRNRRAIRRLDELSDWELLDIGLTREDVACAQSGSILDDPIAGLIQARNSRERAEVAIRRRP